MITVVIPQLGLVFNVESETKAIESSKFKFASINGKLFVKRVSDNAIIVLEEGKRMIVSPRVNDPRVEIKYSPILELISDDVDEEYLDDLCYLAGKLDEKESEVLDKFFGLS